MIFAIFVAAIIVLLWTAARFSRMSTKAMLCYEHDVGRFQAAASALAADPDTPAAILRTLSVLNDQITDPATARAFVRFLESGRGAAAKKRTPEREEAVQFLARRPELAQQFHIATISALLAVSWRAPLYGRILRSWLTGVSDPPGPAENAAFGYREHRWERTKGGQNSNHKAVA